MRKYEMPGIREVLAHIGDHRKPGQDPREKELLMIRQIHELNRRAFERAKSVEFHAELARADAEKAFRETQVRVELLEEELGINDEDGEEHA